MIKKLLLFTITIGTTVGVNAQITFEEIISTPSQPTLNNDFTAVDDGTIAHADIDGDGDEDVLIMGAIIWSNFITKLYRNDGQGNYTSVANTTFPGLYRGDAAFEDFDADGDLDLLIMGENTFQQGVTELYRNDGLGNFAKVSNTPFIRAGSGVIEVGDLDGDGDKDVLITGTALAGYPNTLTYFNDGLGNFTLRNTTMLLGKGGDAALADFDGDGDLDILIAGLNSGTFRGVGLFTNDGLGNFMEVPNMPFIATSESSVAVSDIDADGDQDVVLSGRTDANFSGLTKLYTNNGFGIFTEVTQDPFAGTRVSIFEFEDVDNDGDEDILIVGGSPTNGYVNLYRNNGLGVFTADAEVRVLYSNYPAFAFLDRDGDGDLDLLTTGEVDNPINRVDYYNNDGTGSFKYYALPLLPKVTNSAVAHADVDADGDQDILISGYSNAFLKPISELYKNDGNGNYVYVSNQPFLGMSQGSVAFADIDADGDQDLIITGRNGANIETTKLYINDSTGNFTVDTSNTLINSGLGTVAFTDVDGDNDQDLFIVGYAAGNGHGNLYINNGAGQFTNSGIAFQSGSLGDMAVADIDGDGDQDVLIASNSTATLYKNNGQGVFTVVANTPFPGLLYGSIDMADIDGDGDVDVLITGINSFAVPSNWQTKLYRNNGTGTYTEVGGTPFPGVYNGDTDFGDVDGDGDMDIVLSGRTTQSMGSEITKLYTNNGSGSFTENTTVSLARAFEGTVNFLDIDGSINSDLIITGNYVASVYKNTSPLYCKKPITLGTVVTGATSLQFNWQEAGNATQWQVVYGFQYFNPQDPNVATTIDVADTPTLTINNLLPNRAYSFYVRAICSSTNFSDLAGTVTATTLCEAYGNFQEGFETTSTSQLPQCWKSIRTTPAGSPAGAIGVLTSNMYSGTKVLGLYNNSDAAGTYIAVAPPLSALSQGSHELRFFAKSNNGTNSVVIGTLSDPNNGATFIPKQTIALTANYIEYVVNFDTSTTNNFLGFKAAFAGASQVIYIDEISWQEIPSCPRPTALAVNSTNNSATVSWSPGNAETAWEVIYGEIGFDIENPTEATTVQVLNTPTVTISNLTPNTNYQYYVRAICSGNGASITVGPVTSATACNPASIPFFEGFETGNIDQQVLAGCWTQESIAGAQSWVTNTSQTSNERTPRTGSWNATIFRANQDWIFYPLQLTGGTTYQLSFYARKFQTTGASILASYGTANNAAAMTNEIIASSTVTNGAYQEFSGSFTPTNSGIYYVGIKATLNVVTTYLSLDDISITVADPCPITTTWSNSVWSNGTPAAATKVVITENYNTETNGNIEACSITVNSGATLTVCANTYLIIQNNIVNNGTIEVTHHGTIVQISEAATVTNNGTINVKSTTPSLEPREFVLMGSPMTTETREGVFGNAYDLRNHITANFVPNPEVAMAMPDAVNFADDNLNNWQSHSGAINPGEGYLVRPQRDNETSGSYDLIFTNGTLNTGEITFTVGYNTDANNSPNILANPYPSAIDATDFINANAMVNEVYFWEHLTPPSTSIPGANQMNFSMEDISMYNLTGGMASTSGGTAPDGSIATAQGFAIKANAAGTATFNNAMRRIPSMNQLRSNTVQDKIWLKIANEEFNINRTALIGFSENATAALDNGYDSRRLATVLSLYSHLENGSEELGIQCRESFGAAIKIPLGFSSQIAAEVDYIISIENLEGASLETATVYLADNHLNILTNLSEENYNFRSNEGTYNGRFTILFENNPELGITENSLDNIALFPNPVKNTITIATKGQGISSITIRDIRGRTVQQTKTNGEQTQIVNISQLESAVYLVAITTERGTLVKRIIKE